LDFSKLDAQHLPRQHFDQRHRSLSHEKTLTIFEWFFHDVASQKNQERIKRAVSFSDEVQQEDISLCENVQRGLRSSTYDRDVTPLSVKTAFTFHMLLGEFLGQV